MQSRAASVRHRWQRLVQFSGEALRPLSSRVRPSNVSVGGVQVDLSGVATASATQALAERFPQMDYRTIPRSGWSVSRLGFGGDDLGSRPDERQKLLTYSVRRRGVNLLEVDLDTLHARFDPASSLYEPSPADRVWERRALLRMVQQGWIARSELVVAAVSSCIPADTSRDGRGRKALSAEELLSRAERALEWLGLEAFDVFFAHVPASQSEFGAVEMEDLVQTLEQGMCRERRSAQGWGISCGAFSALEQGSTLDHSGRSLKAQPLPLILNAAVRAASSSGEGQHRMLAVRYLGSATNTAAFVPAVVDQGGSELSVADILSKLKVAQFLKGGFDSVRDGRLFRAIDSDDHEPFDEKSFVGQLNEAMNYAIHLEFMFDKEVGAAGRAELARMREEWESNRDAALVEELCKLKPTAELTEMGEAEKSALAEKFARSLRDAGEGQQLEGLHHLAASSAGVPSPSQSSAVTIPFQGKEGERKTLGLGHAAGRPRKGLTALEMPPPPEPPMAEEVTWARVIANNLHRLDSLAEFEYLWATRIDPAVFRAVRSMGATEACRDWAKGYQATMMTLRHLMTNMLEYRHAPRARAAAEILDSALPEVRPPEDWMKAGSWATDALHDRVLRLLCGTPAEVILTEIPVVYGVKRPGNYGRIRGKDERVVPPKGDVVPFSRIKQTLRGANVEALLHTMVPDLPKAQSMQSIQETLDKGGDEAERLWSRMSEPAKRLFSFPTKKEREAKAAERREELKEEDAAAAHGRSIVDQNR
jgi:hypothetical protein